MWYIYVYKTKFIMMKIETTYAVVVLAIVVH